MLLATAFCVGAAVSHDLLFTTPLYAQTDTAQLTGIVTDSTGAILPGAKVHIHNDATGFDRDATSSASGTYIFPVLPVGGYKITVTYTGFGTYTTTTILTVGGTSTVDAKLGANVNQAVTVESGNEIAVVNLVSSEVSTTISPQELQSLPSLTRNPYDFVVLSTGVTSDPNGSTSRGVGVSLNGNRAASTEILLDGVENADSYDATAAQQIPLDAVQEYSIIVNGFDSQYGRASGGVVNLITQSGTNHFHGSAYEYNRVSDLAANTYNEDAVNYANRAAGLPNNPSDHFTRNQFGFTVGGPIIRDKLFFFTNYEWNRIRSVGATNFEVPTAAFLASAAPATQAFFTAYGSTLAPGTTLGATVASPVTPPAADGTGGGVPYFPFAPLQVATVHAASDAGAGVPVNSFFGDSKFDFVASNRLTMYFRGATFNDTFPQGSNSLSPYTGYNTGQTDFNQSYLYSATYQFTPNLFSTSKVSYSRINTNQPLASAGITPSLYLNQANVASTDPATNNYIGFPGYVPLEPGDALPFGGPQNTYQFIEDVSWTKGKHTIKAGGQFIQIRDNRTFGAYENAVELVAKSGTALGPALLQLQAGNDYTFEVAINPQGKLPCSYDLEGDLTQTPACSVTLPASSPSFVRENTFNDGNWYVQDQFKATSRLTLTGGIRWEYYGVQHNSNPNLESNFYLGTGSNLAQQVATGNVLTTPNSPTHGLVAKDLKNYAPRIGFAFDPKGDGKWAIRGGYGISYERNFGNVTYNVIQNPPNYAGVTLQSTATDQLSIATPNFGPFAGAGGAPVALAPSSLRALQQNMPTAYAHQYSLTIEHEIAPNDLLSVFYSGSRGIHQYAIGDVNGVGYGLMNGYGADGGVNPDGSLPYHLDRLNPQYGAINIREANGDSHYDSLNVSMKVANLSHYGLQAVVSYTYAHSLDNLSSTFSESGNNFNLGYLNPFNPRLDYGNSDYDTKHRFSIGGIYQPSFLEFKGNHLLHSTVGGLQFDPIATVRSGTPFTIYDCTNGENACPRIVAAPDVKFHGTPQPNGGTNSFDFINIPTDSGNTFTNALGLSDFPTTYGGYQNSGLGRNQWFGPNNISFDMGVHKDFRFGSSDRYVAQIRGEFYDILNHHNFYPLVGTADYAEVSNVGVVKGSPGGNPTSADERRNVQIALRLSF